MATQRQLKNACSNENKQELIGQLLEEAIIAGRWKLFEYLPPERQLALEFKVNRNTLRGAISALVGRGLLEKEPGRQSRVIALPNDGIRDLGEKIRACQILAPAVIHAVALVIRPSHVMDLERVFPVAGAALRNDDIKGFTQSQLSFFRDCAAILENNTINMAVHNSLPQARHLSGLLSRRGLQENEILFAHLARILGFLRHVMAKEAYGATEAYFTFMATFMERE